MILFDKIKISEQEHEDYLNHMTLDMSVVNIVSALMYAQSKGVFGLNESEILAKSIRVLENAPNNKKK